MMIPIFFIFKTPYELSVHYPGLNKQCDICLDEHDIFPDRSIFHNPQDENLRQAF